MSLKCELAEKAAERPFMLFYDRNYAVFVGFDFGKS